MCLWFHELLQAFHPFFICRPLAHSARWERSKAPFFIKKFNVKVERRVTTMFSALARVSSKYWSPMSMNRLHNWLPRQVGIRKGSTQCSWLFQVFRQSKRLRRRVNECEGQREWRKTKSALNNWSTTINSLRTVAWFANWVEPLKPPRSGISLSSKKKYFAANHDKSDWLVNFVH